MTRDEFKRRIKQCMTDIDNGCRGGVCGAIRYDTGLYAVLVFTGLFKPTADENQYWNGYAGCFWLGNGVYNSLSYNEKLDPTTTRLIALGLYEQIILDSKEYEEWE